MSVLVETSLGDIVIDLETDTCPQVCFNFLKLCKIKYYNNVLIHSVEQDFVAKTGDPSGTGQQGESIYKVLNDTPFFTPEIKPQLKHNRIGTVSMDVKQGMCGSRFFITLSEDPLRHLDGHFPVFGYVAEGIDVLQRINDSFCDDQHKPYQNIRLLHFTILDDPFPDHALLFDLIQAESPEYIPDAHDAERIAAYEDPDEKDSRTEAEINRDMLEKQALVDAQNLVMLNSLPDVDVKPPENVLFVCQLNPITTSDDLEIIFSRFGTVLSCEVIKDWKTKDSLQYAFIEYKDVKDCEAAYIKMNDVVVDDRRIKVDFSQSVSKLWNNFNRKGDPSKVNNNNNDNNDNSNNSRHSKTSTYKRGTNKRERERSHRSRRDRSRSRDRRRDRSRDRSRSRDRRRDRSRSRERRRYRSRSPKRHRM